ncbi:PREDICTED: transmembrane protein 43-like [Priapulus caudatus]|uniref:Transmembrane protein 43-like n=1 Tax=Priapulus caudatus TaxID=37621 RepID=A0ABM1EET9_PRICU|nr:PREDICTED: transmembrane protein 43-like [Priapulus caudatus]XP_014670710.1 PREDICTED: transmembrane protein 43-like [Priapulus caudatus]
MTDHFAPEKTTVTTEEDDDEDDFFARVRRSVAAVPLGLLLIAIGVGLLFWNEGRAVGTARSLEEALSLVRPLRSHEVAVEEYDGKLIHLVAPLRTKVWLSDPAYNVELSAVKLKRTVEMYQWVEEEHTREADDGREVIRETSYSYSKKWMEELVRSASFDSPHLHKNPKQMAVTSAEYRAPAAYAGAFQLSDGLVNRINNFKVLKSLKLPQGSDAKVTKGYFYHGEAPLSPAIGDVRVQFLYAGLLMIKFKLGPRDSVSVLAKQAGLRLVPYHTRAGDVLELLAIGELSAADMISLERAYNMKLTWGLRALGWFLQFLGFTCMTTIITELLSWLPLVRDFIKASASPP